MPTAFRRLIPGFDGALHMAGAQSEATAPLRKDLVNRRRFQRARMSMRISCQAGEALFALKLP